MRHRCGQCFAVPLAVCASGVEQRSAGVDGELKDLFPHSEMQPNVVIADQALIVASFKPAR